MRIFRVLGALLSLALVVSFPFVPMSRSGAQEPAIALTLIAQTPITTRDEPEVTITLRAENLGEEPYEDLSVGFLIGQQITSRVQYELSLVEGPLDPLIYVDTFTQDGSLDPGASREFDVGVDLGAIDGISDLDSFVYPARLDLRSAGAPVATLDTPLVHLVRDPEVPIRLSWWAEFDAPIAMDPQGRLDDPAFEVAIAERGALRQQVETLRTAVSGDDGAVGVDLVVTPAVVEQLTRMADGYERSFGEPVRVDEPPATHAASLLGSLRTLVADPDVHLVTTPFSGPLLPSLASGGLARDLARQQMLGDTIVADELDRTPTAVTARPPQGAVDEPSLQWLADRGTATLLMQAESVERAVQPNEFAPLPVATATTADGTQLDVVLPDPGVQDLLGDPILLADPVLAGQAVLGELATIWREQPVPGPQPDGSETVRGIAVALPASLPAGMWGPIVRRLTQAPFLVPTQAAEFVDVVMPGQGPATIVTSTERFPRDYVDAIRDQRRNVNAYRSMLTAQSPQPERLDRNLLYAEAGEFVVEPDVGRRWYDQVNAVTGSIFANVLPDVAQEFLLTSSEGSIPLRMGDPGPSPLTVQIVMRSASFEFPTGAERTVTLEGPDEVVTVDVVAKASGPQTIRVKTRAPSGRDLGEDQNLVVRTTAVNSVALWITVGAGVLLLLLWARRLIRRPTPSPPTP
ncbi:MAG TPA: DUF6049 family protein [Actinomycetota bacterium]|nr:DUF6049 family protein [Actinomycetota bacterium]